LDKPTAIENAEGKIVLVNQVGWAGINVGRIDFYFDDKELKEQNSLVMEV
jgi:5'-nucleotidase